MIAFFGVSGSEIGRTAEQRTSSAVAFRDAPSLQFVKRVFPVGSVLHGEEASPVDKLPA